MFTSISWQQYLLATFGLVVIYYGAVLLLFFRVELALLFQGKRAAFSISSSSGVSRRESILGEAKQEAIVTSISNEELQFTSENETN